MGKPQPSLAGLTFQLLQKVLQSVDDQPGLAGIGEIQSQPRITKKSKTAAIAQAGIYGVGQLAKTNKITIVVIFKDKSAIVAMSSITPAETSLPNSLGEPSFQFVNRIDSMSLKDPAELQEFCNILITTLK